jgi:CRISPR/Cas system CMR subunit Cmr4 (Cas7 group RAMP superfamily)
MNINKVITSAKNKKYLEINETDLNELLLNSKLIQEENTYISDKIRLLEINGNLILQEKTTKGEYLIRIINTIKEAKELIKNRLEIYEKMWDGCGCKVDYYQ